MNDWFASLTDAQRAAVTHVEGPLLILAGPGSGKTRVVTSRVAHMISEGIPPRQILALTFTNKAANEMAERVKALAPGRPVWIGTFHRFCARLLREFAPLVGLEENFTIYDTSDSLGVIKDAMEATLGGMDLIKPQRVAHEIGWAKHCLITPEKYAESTGSPLKSVAAKVYPAYREALLKANAVDFDDLLMHVALLLRDNPELRSRLDARYRYTLVDEYQDTNLAQYTIARALSIDHPNLAVTGDPDQSIYGWRGAHLGNILDFERDYPEVKIVRLERNYRSTRRILRAAQKLISHNVKRKEKDLFTENEEGSRVKFTEYPTESDEARQIAYRIREETRAGRRRPRDFAIFYRANALSRSFEFAMREMGVPYQIVNGLEFYQRQEIKDVLGYLTLLNNPRDTAAFKRVINTPARGIGKATVRKLADHAAAGGRPLLEAARQAGLVAGVSKRAAVAVARFVTLYDRLSEFSRRPVEEILGQVLTLTGYTAELAATELEEDQERLANIEELLSAARQFDERNPGEGHLEAFLEESSLVNDTDAWEGEDDRVTLMTLHASKGLEFPVVFVVALEHGLLPHERSMEDRDSIEEERRLLFVGMTRAKRELWLSMARRRDFRGTRRTAIPSGFLEELPREEIEGLDQDWRDSGLDPAAPGWHGGELDGQGIDPCARDMADREYDEWDTDFEPWKYEAGDSMTSAPEEAPRPTVKEGTASVSPSSSGVTTAARLAGAPTSAADYVAFEPDSFSLGMVVVHPEYGAGKIVALSGGGDRRLATVSFPAAGEKKFVLAKSKLRPAQRP